MAIKVTKNDEKHEPKVGFPKLMIGLGRTICIMTAPGKGTVVSSERYEVGHKSEGWAADGFEDYHGTVTLENE